MLDSPLIASTNCESDIDAKVDKNYHINFCLFMMLGAAPNWVFATALAQEIPHFQEALPQGLCIATYMNATTNFGLLALFGYVVWNYYHPIPQKIAVPFLIYLCAFSTLLTAFTCSITVNNVPVLLLVCCALGGTVGSLSAVILNPFLTYFENDYISAANCGGSVGIVLTALVGLAQNPGSEHERFSTEVFFIIFFCLLASSIIAFYYIVFNNIGLRDPQISPFSGLKPPESNIEGGILVYSTRSSVASFVVLAPLIEAKADSNIVVNAQGEMEITNSMSSKSFKCNSLKSFKDNSANCATSDTITPSTITPETDMGVSPESLATPPIGEADFEAVMATTESPRVDVEDQRAERASDHDEAEARSCWDADAVSDCLIRHLLPCAFVDSVPWLRQALPYMLTVGWVDFNTWGMISALIPFAIANVSEYGGAGNLAIAFEAGAVALVLGDILTTKFEWPFYVSLTIFTTISLVIYMCAFGLVVDVGFGPWLVALFSINRLQEEYLKVQSFRAVATRLPLEHREAASRAVGLTDQIMTTLGAALSTALVTSIVTC